MAGKLMLLGGSAYLVPVIREAHDLGIEVITCDFLPDNYAHRFADVYENVSIIDERAVLATARRHGVSGIMSFATDPGVTTAAYVAEQMGLPFQCSREVAGMLQDKHRFRTFMAEHGFAAPRHFVCGSAEEALDAYGAGWGHVIVKPIDSAGSKGAGSARNADELVSAVQRALDFSRAGRCIVEEWVDCDSALLETDVFTLDGEVLDFILTAQMHDEDAPNPVAPAASLIPPLGATRYHEPLKDELQRLADVLALRTGIYNIEARVNREGRLYIMEVSPRGGGPHIALIQQAAGDMNVVRASVQAAMGMPVDVSAPDPVPGVFLQDMVHVNADGIYRGVRYAPGFKEDHVVWEEMWRQPGEAVDAFNGANNVFGSILLHFHDEDEYRRFAADPATGYEVLVD